MPKQIRERSASQAPASVRRNHVSAELFKMMAEGDMLQVPYRSSAQALTDLVGGQVQVMFGSMPSSIEYIRRQIARAGGDNCKPVGCVAGPLDCEWFRSRIRGQWLVWPGAPRNNPSQIVDFLNEEINAALVAPKRKAQPRTPAAYRYSGPTVVTWLPMRLRRGARSSGSPA